MEVFAGVGLIVCMLIGIILLAVWVDTLQRYGEMRENAIFHGNERKKVEATRKFFLWMTIPVTFPFVLLYLLIVAIIKGIMKIIDVTKDLQLGKSLDKIEEESTD